jgi:hypothetical protein
MTEVLGINYQGMTQQDWDCLQATLASDSWFFEEEFDQETTELMEVEPCLQ